jgi:hypothetical protein
MEGKTVTVVYAIVGTLTGLAAWGYLSRFLYLTRLSRRSLTGVALKTLASALALTFTFISVNLWFTVIAGSSNWTGRVYVGTGLFGLLAIAVILMWVAFEKAQRK